LEGEKTQDDGLGHGGTSGGRGRRGCIRRHESPGTGAVNQRKKGVTPLERRSTRKRTKVFRNWVVGKRRGDQKNRAREKKAQKHASGKEPPK